MSDFQKYLDDNLSKVRIDISDIPERKKDYDIYKDIRKLIVSERKKQNITQKELSRLTNLSQSNISNIERGMMKPTIDSLKRIGDALGKRLVISFEDWEDYEL